MTRQSANIMDDLRRQLNKPEVIFLIYGKEGVGKSSLVQQFISSFQGNEPIVYLIFSDDGEYVCKSRDNVSLSQHSFLKSELNTIATGSIVVIDDFQHARNSVRTQVLLFWSTHAARRGIKLIITGSSDAARALADYSQHFKLEVNSVKIKPLQRDEQLDFLASRYCRGARQSLVLNKTLKTILRQSGGLFANLSDISQSQIQQLKCKDAVSGRHHNRNLLVIFLIILITAGLLLSIKQSKHSADEVTVEIPSGQFDNSRPAQPIISSKALDQDATAGTDIEEGLVLESNTASSIKEPIKPVSEKIFKHDTKLELEKKGQQLEPVIINQSAAQSLPATRLNARLEATRKWLAESDNRQASIQIMTLGLTDNPEGALSRYLDDLVKKGIDLDKVFVYPAPTKSSKIFGVLYGVYHNRKAATDSIAQLPRSLRANGPIPRTVKGIKQEIMQNSLR